MKVGDKVAVRNPIPGGSDVVEGVATVRELMYGDEWADGMPAEVEFDNEPGRTYCRAIWEADKIE
jgi:hypothetical protein